MLLWKILSIHVIGSDIHIQQNRQIAADTSSDSSLIRDYIESTYIFCNVRRLHFCLFRFWAPTMNRGDIRVVDVSFPMSIKLSRPILAAYINIYRPVGA